ncbi:fused MFS/spermidine synthase [Undibacterium rugosum]|uniref:fused MFS/spermidine synthase n=1 Tax=Undibacterium rugosum TaxID=2762291 RepID=UPI001B81EDCA|nr:fused MFS/spermidine synthase [Undibacterium rugosum]MBR7776929.1 fused MFS/spermidine synthase [Undibacterium rugosum]
MANRRPSLSQLFLNSSPDPAEQAHQKRLRTLAKASDGRAFVLDDAPLRMMYLTPKCMQSVMHLEQPDALLCAYSQWMMGFRLFQEQARDFLLIGLGGGSLAKHILTHLPESHITALEINPDVIALRDAFALPANDKRLQVILADGASYLPAMAQQVDVIFLDAYDKQGLVPALNTAGFYRSCQQHLRPQGVLVANVWGKPSNIAQMLHSLRGQFSEVCWARSPDSYNLIVFASQQALEQKVLQQRASHLQQVQPELPWPRIAASFDRLPGPATQQDLEILTEKMRQLLVMDQNVPATYAAWRTLVLNRP